MILIVPFFRDKDEDVSLTQKLEEIKSNFNSLRRYYTMKHTQTASQAKWANFPTCFS